MTDLDLIFLCLSRQRSNKSTLQIEIISADIEIDGEVVGVAILPPESIITA